MKDKVIDVLWISPYAPYDNIGHAGGKTENYFIKELNKFDDVNIHVITCAYFEEKQWLDLDKYDISNDTYIVDDPKTIILKKICNIESTISPFNRYGGLLQNWTEHILKKAIKAYYNEGHQPQIIVLEWTAAIFLVEYIKRLYPNAKLIGIEEDVTFQSYQRKVMNTKGFTKIKWRLRLCNVKNSEICSVNKLDYTFVYTEKDKELLNREDVDCKRISSISTFYNDYSDIQYYGDQKYIVYYGAMGRKENYEAALYVIDRVLPKIKDEEIEFIIIGSNPPKQLIDRDGGRIHVLGFVDDPFEILKHAICLVAPLFEGAGIKVKILEAMSAGVPVLTNEIGIEGIPAKQNSEYYMCNGADDYAARIEELCDDSVKRFTISNYEKKFIKKCFNPTESVIQIHDLLVN